MSYVPHDEVVQELKAARKIAQLVGHGQAADTKGINSLNLFESGQYSPELRSLENYVRLLCADDERSYVEFDFVKKEHLGILQKLREQHAQDLRTAIGKLPPPVFSLKQESSGRLQDAIEQRIRRAQALTRTRAFPPSPPASNNDATGGGAYSSRLSRHADGFGLVIVFNFEPRKTGSYLIPVNATVNTIVRELRAARIDNGIEGRDVAFRMGKRPADFSALCRYKTIQCGELEKLVRASRCSEFECRVMDKSTLEQFNNTSAVLDRRLRDNILLLKSGRLPSLEKDKPAAKRVRPRADRAEVLPAKKPAKVNPPDKSSGRRPNLGSPKPAAKCARPEHDRAEVLPARKPASSNPLDKSGGRRPNLGSPKPAAERERARPKDDRAKDLPAQKPASSNPLDRFQSMCEQFSGLKTSAPADANRVKGAIFSVSTLLSEILSNADQTMARKLIEMMPENLARELPRQRPTITADLLNTALQNGIPPRRPSSFQHLPLTLRVTARNALREYREFTERAGSAKNPDARMWQIIAIMATRLNESAD